MSKAEESYKYALNKEKYDSDVVKAVDKKILKKKDANTVNKIQDMMRKEREEQRNKKSRQVVTSENREDFMAKKLGLSKEQKPVMKEEKRKEDKPHAIFNKETGIIHSRYPNFAKARMTFEDMGKRAEEHEIKELDK
jgi:hypothetical protein